MILHDFLYCEKNLFFFCNEIAQDIYTVVLKKKERKISLHCVKVNVCVTLPEAFYCLFA